LGHSPSIFRRFDLSGNSPEAAVEELLRKSGESFSISCQAGETFTFGRIGQTIAVGLFKKLGDRLFVTPLAAPDKAACCDCYFGKPCGSNDSVGSA